MKQNVLVLTTMTKHWQYAKHMKLDATEQAMSFDIVFLSCADIQEKELVKRIESSSIVLFTHVGSDFDSPFLKRLYGVLKASSIPYLCIMHDSKSDVYAQGMTEEEIERTLLYLRQGGGENFQSLCLFLSSVVGGTDVVPPVVTLPYEGIVSRDGEVYETYAAYGEEWDPQDRPVVALFFYRDEWVQGDLTYPYAVYDELERQGIAPVLVFGQYGSKGDNQLRWHQIWTTIFGERPEQVLSLIINSCKFSIQGLQGVTIEELEVFSIPLLQGFVTYTTLEEWRSRPQGLLPMDISFSLSLPEMDGIGNGHIISTRAFTEEKGYYFAPYEEGIRCLVKQCKGWIRLQETKRSDVKLAIFLHNYLPKNSHIGSACGLDTPESVLSLLRELDIAGYDVGILPATSAELMEILTKCATNDVNCLTEEAIVKAPKLSSPSYHEWFESTSQAVQEEMVHHWGEPVGTVFVEEEELIIPGIAFGNVWVLVQPPRGFSDNPDALYHSPTMPPTHHYESVYEWIRRVWQTHAIIHMGTHGNLEWLPGKGTALSGSCYPELGIEDVPNLYPYWTTIVGEGIQAKRRSHAILISYLSPPMKRAGLYGDYEELERHIDEYGHVQSLETHQESTVFAYILRSLAMCKMGHLCESYDWFHGDLAEIFCTMTTMTIRTNPLEQDTQGVSQDTKECHTLNDTENTISPLRDKDQCNGAYLSQIDMSAWHRWAEMIPLEIQNEIISEAHNYLMDISNRHIRVGLHVLGENPSEEEEWGFIDAFLDLSKHAEEDTKEEPHQYEDDTLSSIQAFKAYKQSVLGDDEERDESLEERAYHMLASLQYPTDDIHVQSVMTYLERIRCTTDEMSLLVRALEGKYIPPRPGGAVTNGGLQVLPTGRNFYGIDERTMPTPSAYDIGKKLGDGLLSSYMEEEKRYPQEVGIVLWADNNTRTHGQCVGQVFYLLGVEPTYTSGRVTGLSVIPLSELGRPRIDVTCRISGLFRDMMPSSVKWISKAVKMVAALDESHDVNYVKRHVEEDRDALVESGMELERAIEEASWRVFGDAPGAYGAGINQILEQQNWSSRADLGNAYVTWGGYGYGEDGSIQQGHERFRRRLEKIEVTIKNEDNREVSLLSTDDFNAYHGGMISAVEMVQGKQPKSFIGDTTYQGQVIVRSLKDEIGRQFRSEAMNPQFIEGMMKHGYKGASDLASYVQHTFEWDATSDMIQDWMYDAYTDAYALDETVQSWMSKVNPWALGSICETLLEAEQRGFWEASEERIEALRNLALSLDGDLEAYYD